MSDSFRHPTNFHNDPRVSMLLEEHGLVAYGVYWILAELICSRPSLQVRYPVRSLARFTYLRTPRLLKFLDALHDVGLLSVDVVGGFATVSLADRFGSADNRCAGPEWADLRAVVFKRDGYRCAYCGTVGGRLECDHKLPVSRGGLDELSNLVTACFDCNRSKGAKTVEEFLLEKKRTIQ